MTSYLTKDDGEAALPRLEDAEITLRALSEVDMFVSKMGGELLFENNNDASGAAFDVGKGECCFYLTLRFKTSLLKKYLLESISENEEA